MPGRNQRLDRHNAQHEQVAASFLVNALLYDMMWGNLPAYSVQKYADAALRDGLDHPAVRKVAMTGRRGANPRHIRAQIVGMLKASPLQDAISMTKIPMLHVRLGILFASQPIIMPHVFFSVLYHHYRNAFDNIYIGLGRGSEKLVARHEREPSVRGSPHQR
jgi:hypothetical protein